MNLAYLISPSHDLRNDFRTTLVNDTLPPRNPSAHQSVECGHYRGNEQQEIDMRTSKLSGSTAPAYFRCQIANAAALAQQ